MRGTLWTLWGAAVVLLGIAWVAGLFQRRALCRFSADGRSVVAFESRAGQLLLLSVSLRDGQIDPALSSEIRTNRFNTDSVDLCWRAQGDDGSIRFLPVKMIHPRGQYIGTVPQLAGDGFRLDLPFWVGCVGLLRGPVHPAGSRLIDEVTWVQLILPNWFILAVLAIPGVFLVRPALSRLRVPPGHCPACGYDLHATPDRCPECGRIHGSNTGVAAEQATGQDRAGVIHASAFR